MQVDSPAVGDPDFIFRLKLCGHVVECATLEDAVAVKSADDILRGDDPTPYRPEQLQRLADVLMRYGHRQAASTLVERTG